MTTIAQELVKENPKRAGLLVVNNGTGTVYILSGQSQKYTDGIPVGTSEPYDNDTTTAALWIIASSGSQDVRVEEDGE